MFDFRGVLDKLLHLLVCGVTNKRVADILVSIHYSRGSVNYIKIIQYKIDLKRSLAQSVVLLMDCYYK